MLLEKITSLKYLVTFDSEEEYAQIKEKLADSCRAWLKAKEVMDILSITRVTLCHYVKQGLITIDSTINGKYRYSKDSVYKLLERKQ